MRYMKVLATVCAAAAFAIATPAAASTVVVGSCDSVTDGDAQGCLFSGNINENPDPTNVNSYKNAEAAYNALMNPDITLNWITASDLSDFGDFGSITAGNASQQNDAAAACLVVGLVLIPAIYLLAVGPLCLWYKGRNAPTLLIAFYAPLAWLAFTLLRGPWLDWYPYSILDVPRMGYSGVSAYVAAILAFFFAVAALMWVLDRLLVTGKRR